MDETVPCIYCGRLTIMTATQLCDRCWELKARLSMDVELAEKILNAIKLNKINQ